MGCRIPCLAALVAVPGDMTLAVSTNLNFINVIVAEIKKMMFHSILKVRLKTSEHYCWLHIKHRSSNELTLKYSLL